jgi:hypothetical protein
LAGDGKERKQLVLIGEESFQTISQGIAGEKGNFPSYSQLVEWSINDFYDYFSIFLFLIKFDFQDSPK